MLDTDILILHILSNLLYMLYIYAVYALGSACGYTAPCAEICNALLGLYNQLVKFLCMNQVLSTSSGSAKCLAKYISN